MEKAMFSSATVEWPTPRDFFEKCAAEFGPFDLDPCATVENAKAARYYTKQDDGLAQSWTGRVWMNPPYGRTIGAWMRKAYEEAAKGAVVVCLVPARTDTAWWHDYAAKGKVRFLRGRLKFEGSKSNAPFPSALIVFGDNNGMYGLSTRTTNGLLASGVDMATEESARKGAAAVYGNGKFLLMKQVGKKSVRELQEWLERGGNGSADDRKCPSCRFWDKDGSETEDMGQCRRYAPRPHPQTDCLYWPLTFNTDWCGEWVRR